MTLHHTEPVPKLESVLPGRTFPPNLGLVIEKMLAKYPDDRYPTMAAVAQDLKNVVDGVALGTVQALPENFGTASGTFDALPAFSPLVELRIAAVQHGERDGAVNADIRAGAASEELGGSLFTGGGNNTSVAGLFSNPMVLVGIMLVLAMAICCAVYSGAIPAGH